MATARPDTWMPIYWGDYAKDTGHLSAAHHGAYLMLIKHYWVTGAPLPNDDGQLWRIACADSLPHWRRLKAVVLAFFELKDGLLYHGRVEKELVSAGRNANRRADLARKAAAARWRNGGSGAQSPPHAPSNASGNAPRMPQIDEHTLTPSAAAADVSTAKITDVPGQDIEIVENANAVSNAPSMSDAVLGECPPPSPSTVTAVCTVADSASINGAWEPDGGSDDLAIPAFLRRAPPSRAQLITADWQPSAEAKAQLRKSRPDITDDLLDRRMIEFRTWCASNAKTTFNPDATWLGFMVKTHAQRSGSDGKSGLSASLEALAEFGREGTGG